MQYYSGRREARRFTELVYAKRPEGIRAVPDSKLFARELAEQLGIRVPQEIARFARPADVELGALPDRFVLKATKLVSKMGVYLLTRRGPDAYFDRFSGKTFTTDDLRADLARHLAAKKRPADTPVLVEELIIGENGPDEVPYDYKFYTFDGEPELITQTNRNTKPDGMAFFGRNFTPLPTHHFNLGRKLVFMEHRRPENWRDLIDVAQRITRHLDAPFARVDLYTTGSEVILGELTPRPGGPYYGLWRFSDEFDGELGAYYRRAYQRRGARIPIVTRLPPVLARHEAELEASRRPRLPEGLRKLARRVLKKLRG